MLLRWETFIAGYLSTLHTEPHTQPQFSKRYSFRQAFPRITPAVLAPRGSTLAQRQLLVFSNSKSHLHSHLINLANLPSEESTEGRYHIYPSACKLSRGWEKVPWLRDSGGDQDNTLRLWLFLQPRCFCPYRP